MLLQLLIYSSFVRVLQCGLFYDFYMCSYIVFIIIIPECLMVAHWIIYIHCIFVLSASPKETSVCEREFLLAIKAVHRCTVICAREGTLQEICLVIRVIWWFFNSCGRTSSFLLAVFSLHLALLQKGEAPLSHESIFIEILTCVWIQEWWMLI